MPLSNSAKTEILYADNTIQFTPVKKNLTKMPLAFHNLNVTQYMNSILVIFIL